MNKKPKLAVVGPTPAQLANGQVIPSTHQMLADAKTMLCDELANLAALRDSSESGEEADLERSATLTKNALARMDALKKALQVAALIREEAAAAQRERIGGVDISQLTDDQLEAMLQLRKTPAVKPEGDE